MPQMLKRYPEFLFSIAAVFACRTRAYTIKNTTECMNIVRAWNDSREAIVGVEKSVSLQEALGATIGFGVFACLLAFAFTFIRKHVYKDKENLDTAFDAGGKVSIGLTATTIVSQWTWAATLLQSSTVASKYGVSGPFWYAAGATIQILLFAMLSVQLKIRAPGAKTFLQVIKARFGLRAHIVFCVFALATNLIVTSMLMLGGAAVLTSLVDGLSVEYATILVLAIIGAYTIIGGLGATFYVSYFNTAIIYIIMIVFIMTVYNSNDSPLGSIDRVYSLVSCSVAPEGNKERSYFTILSHSGLMFGIINIVGNFGTVFVDQSYWQSAVAAKPRQGVWGFLTGGMSWFAIPFGLATTMGMAYIALSVEQGEALLTAEQVNAGLVPPVVAQRLLGKQGSMLIMFMILMAITSTGSSEVVAVTSILIYDIYQIHLKPYRKVTDDNSCILCGKGRGRMANPRDKCVCISMTHCEECAHDDSQRHDAKRAIKPAFRCQTHGKFREYNAYLHGLKNWCLVWITVAIFPLTMILDMLHLSLGWLYLFMGILIGSAVLPITLSMFWTRLTACGMIWGSISGTIAAIISWLIAASTKDGGLSNFMDNTGDEISMLCGNLVSILGGGLVCVIISLVTTRHVDPDKAAEIWENTRDIDSPLSPWTEMYARELGLSGVHQLDNRPSLFEVQRTFKNARYVANTGAIVLTIILVFLWPSIMVAVDVMTLQNFNDWVILSEALAFFAAIFIIIAPVINEAWDIRKVLHQNKDEQQHNLTRAESRKTTSCKSPSKASRMCRIASMPADQQVIEVAPIVANGDVDKEHKQAIPSTVIIQEPDQGFQFEQRKNLVNDENDSEGRTDGQPGAVFC